MKRLPNFLLMMLTTVLLATFITSCSESGSDSDPSTTPTQPQTPVADGDWQVVPATGGTIIKDSLSITFPKGTFPTDTKVAVTEVKSGTILGENEVSKFYQTMPITTARPLTLKIKCTERGEDINPIVQAPAFSYTENKEIYDLFTIESDYSNGEYILSFPVFENGESSQTVSIIVGIAHYTRISEDLTTTRVGDYPESLKWGNVSWHYDISTVTYYNYFNNWKKADFSSHIWKALVRLDKLGFKMSDTRNITIQFKEMGEDSYGTFDQSEITDKWSKVVLNTKFLTDYDKFADKLPRTPIHELLHYFQSDYDPRQIPLIKAKSRGDEQTMYECSAVWAEKLNSDGKPSSEFLKTYLNLFLRGIGKKDMPQIYDGYANRKDNIYQQHGYGMSALIEYITTQRTDEGFKNESIIELYELWKKETCYGQAVIPSYTADYVMAWADLHNSKLFVGDNYDDFILKTLTGKVIPDFPIHEMMIQDAIYINKLAGIGENSFEGVCYPYGCCIMKENLMLKTDEFKKEGSLSDKQVVIIQGKTGVQTYVIAKNNKGLIILNNSKATRDSLIIDGATLESLRSGENYNVDFFLISTNRRNEEALPTNVTFKFRETKKDSNASVNPTELTFPAEGNTQSVKVTAQGFTKFGYKISDEYKSWLSAKTVKGGTIEITAQPNTTGKERIGYVRAYVCNEEKPTEAQKVYLKDSIKVTQAANKEPEQQESAYELVGGGVNMYYAVEWRSEIEFKDGDDRVTITPSGKGAKVQIQQSGEDTGRNAEWEYTLSFDVDDLSLYDSKQAKISNFKYEFYKEGKGYDYYGNHVDWEKSETLMTSNAPMQQTAYGNWRFESQDLSYYGLSITHFDKYRTDPYSSYTEHTDKSETKEMTPGSNVTIWLTIKKK